MGALHLAARVVPTCGAEYTKDDGVFRCEDVVPNTVEGVACERVSA